jgi:hypothetical protein
LRVQAAGAGRLGSAQGWRSSTLPQNHGLLLQWY